VCWSIGGSLPRIEDFAQRPWRKDQRISVDVAWLTGGEGLTPNEKGLFRFDEQPYDVIILGDVTPHASRPPTRGVTKIHERCLRRKRTAS